MSRDWYRDHSISPEAAGDQAYFAWAQDSGLYVDVAGNVDYGPPERNVLGHQFVEGQRWCLDCCVTCHREPCDCCEVAT